MALSALVIALAGLIGGPACAASAGTNGDNSTNTIGGDVVAQGGVGGTSGEVQGIPVAGGGDGGAGGLGGAGGTEGEGAGAGGGGAASLVDGVGGAGGNGGSGSLAFGGGGGGGGGFGSVNGGPGVAGGSGGMNGGGGAAALNGTAGANGQGGAGGDGAGGGSPAAGTGGGAGGSGGGGAGGGGLLWTNANASYENSGSLTGGKGGHGAAAADGAGGVPGGSAGGSGGGGGAGGNGGTGVVITATGVTFTNAASGVVRGGDGGSGGSGGSGGNGTSGGANGGAGVAGQGGSGGAGLISAVGWVDNRGTIAGGNGAGTDGNGGAGIVGWGLNVTNSGTITGGTGSGTGQADAIDFVGGANTLTLENGSILSGNVEIGGNGSLAFDQSSAQILGNTITGNGSVIQNGTGTLTLNGINTYTGGTTVQSGTLEVGDAAHPSASLLGNVQVDAGGTLRGHGTVTGDVNNQGIVWPGGSIGTLTIAGEYTQSPSSTLMIDVSPTTASQLQVGGTANLNGTLNLLYGPGTYTPKNYTIVSAGSVSGQFATVSGNTPAGFTQSLAYSPNAVTLGLTSNPGLPPGATAFVVAPTNATIFGALGSAALREAQRVNGALLDRLGRTCWSTDDMDCVRPGKRLWMQARGTFTRIDGNHGAPDVRDDGYGFLVGADRALGAWTVGLAGGYSHGDIQEEPDGASGKIDTLRLQVYGGRRLGGFDIAGTAGYAYDFISTRRDFGSLGHTRGTGHAQELNAGLQASLPWTFRTTADGAWTLTPRLGLRYAYVDGLGLSESGLSSQSLSVGDQRLNSLQPYAGLTLDYAFTTHASTRLAHVGVRAGYAYETQNQSRSVSVTSGDGTGFIIPGIRDARGLTTAGLGADVPLGKAARLYARYDAVLPTGNIRAQTVQVGFSYRFH